MCGISGIYGFEDVSIATELINKMNNSLIHRGPNDEGSFTEVNIALGHRRLSIIDLSKAGHQPMESIDGRYSIVFNGEIYNFLEIKSKISKMGFQFTTNSDTECLHLQYGTSN